MMNEECDASLACKVGREKKYFEYIDVKYSRFASFTSVGTNCYQDE